MFTVVRSGDRPGVHSVDGQRIYFRWWISIREQQFVKVFTNVEDFLADLLLDED